MSTPDDVTPQAEKPTDEWVTGDEPMTGPQESYLHTLAQEAGEDVPDDPHQGHSERDDRPAAEEHRSRRLLTPPVLRH